MTAHRTDRIAEVIKKEIALLIQRGVKDPRVEFVTVTRVEVSRDLRYAKVYVSSFKEQAERVSALEGLTRARGFIRGELGRRLTLRRIPELTFKLDDNIEHGMHVSKLLKELNLPDNSGE